MTRLLRRCALTIAVLGVACDDPFSARAELEMTVMELRVPCMGFLGNPQSCLSVRFEGRTEAEAFYDEIEGFNFVEGIRQRIRVERLTLKHPPADGSSYEYRLLAVLDRMSVVVPVVTPLDASASTRTN